MMKKSILAGIIALSVTGGGVAGAAADLIINAKDKAVDKYSAEATMAIAQGLDNEPMRDSIYAHDYMKKKAASFDDAAQAYYNQQMDAFWEKAGDAERQKRGLIEKRIDEEYDQQLEAFKAAIDSVIKSNGYARLDDPYYKDGSVAFDLGEGDSK